MSPVETIWPRALCGSKSAIVGECGEAKNKFKGLDRKYLIILVFPE
jgi:hypothetical protein